MTVQIKRLDIANFRSIDQVSLENPPPFAVFAGPNGSGKSNFFAALDFLSTAIQTNGNIAIRKYGGNEHIYPSWKIENSDERNSYFSLNCFIKGADELNYVNKMRLDEPSKMNEEFVVIHNDMHFPVMLRNGDTGQILWGESEFIPSSLRNTDKKTLNSMPYRIPVMQSFLAFAPYSKAMDDFLKSIQLFQIKPSLSKEASRAHQDSSRLLAHGENFACVLNRLEKNNEIWERILEWVQSYIPEMASIETRRHSLDGSTLLLFKEQGSERPFPGHLISDGTIYLLNLLVSVIDRSFPSWTLIEEPERGLHPKAIIDLIPWLREEAGKSGPIWLTTHSETVVRQLQDGELWWVDKKEGRTTIQPASDLPVKNMRRDQAWLSGALGGGLPW